MSRRARVACAMAALLCVGSWAMAEGLGFTVGLDAALGDVLSEVSIELTPYVEWTHSFGIADLTLHGEYTKSLASSGAGSAMVSEDLTVSFGDKLTITPGLYNTNTYSFEGAGLSGQVEPSVELAVGVPYAKVGLLFDYLPSTGLAAYGTVGAAGEAWTLEATVDLGLSEGFSVQDVVLYGDLSFSIITVSLSATVPGTFTFDSVTLTPELDIAPGGFKFVAKADVELSSSITSVSPTVGISFSF